MTAMSKSQQPQHPPTQWNMRGGRGSSVAYTLVHKNPDKMAEKSYICICPKREILAGRLLSF